MNNIDQATVVGFGDEWTRFDQHQLSERELLVLFNKYFSIFPWHRIKNDSVGFDLGCGSGRWAKLVAPRVGTLYCIDPSSAIQVAQKNLIGVENCCFLKASADCIPLPERSMDFGYSLGVLHHIPDTRAALMGCVKKLKPGAPFLLYLYYNFDNRPLWYAWLWKGSEMIRFVVSRQPLGLRYFLSQMIAVFIYLPLSRLAKILESFGCNVENLPLSAYRERELYVIRTDALDRFGTRLEQRFSKCEIRQMMEFAGLEGVVFSDSDPFWCAVGFAKGKS